MTSEQVAMSDEHRRLNPGIDDIAAELRADELASVQARDVAERLESLSIAGVLQGLVRDSSAEEVLATGAAEGLWP